MDILENTHYDLVLLDIQMSEMSGFDVAKAIREKEEIRGGHIPIIATTAYTMSGDRDRCLSVGMDDFISKPIYMLQDVEFDAMCKGTFLRIFKRIK